MNINSPGTDLLFRKGQLLFLILIAVTLPVKAVQINSICILGLCGLWLIEKISNRQLLKAFVDVRFLALGALFLVYLLSVTYAQNKPYAFSHLETRFSLLVFPLIIFSSPGLTRQEINAILVAFLTMCLLTSLMCVCSTVYTNLCNGIAYTDANSWQYSNVTLVDKFGFHPSYFSVYCSFCIFILIHLYKSNTIRLWVLIGIGIYLIVFQLFLASRIGILAFVALAVITIIYEAHARNKLRLGLLYSLLFSLLVVIGILSSNIMKEKLFAMMNYNVHQYNKQFKVDNRLIQWQSALEVLQNNIWLGTSIGDLQAELVKVYAKRGFPEGYDNRYNTHNLFLETACSTGILGILSLICLFAFSIYSGIKYADTLYLQFLFLFTLLSLVEASLSVQKGVVFFSFFNTLLISQGYLGKDQAVQRTN
jgi:O-antigen ligase